MFSKDFDSYGVVGDRIFCEVDGFDCVATIHADDDTKPDSQDLSLEAFSAWANDEWFYVGIAVTVWKAGVKLTDDYAYALWGIDCNFPSSIDNTNWYLRIVANDLLSEAVRGAKEKIKQLCI
jgi:hypothetical protein